MTQHFDPDAPLFDDDGDGIDETPPVRDAAPARAAGTPTPTTTTATGPRSTADLLGYDFAAAAKRAIEKRAEHARRYPTGCPERCRWCRENPAPTQGLDLESLARAAGLPAKWLEWFKHGRFPPKRNPALLAVEGLERRNAVLAGPTGCGKSTAAAWALWQRCAADARDRRLKPSGAWCSGPELASLSIEHRETFERLTEARLLVIDELAGWTHDRSGYALATLGRLLDHREQAALQTISTTNLIPFPRPGTPAGLSLRERLGANDEERARMWRRLGGDSAVCALGPWSEDDHASRSLFGTPATD